MNFENKQVYLYASGALAFLEARDGEGRFTATDAATALAGTLAHERVQRWRDDPRNAAIRGVWEQKTNAEVADDVRAMLAKIPPGQDRLFLSMTRSRPDSFDPAVSVSYTHLTLPTKA